MTDPAVPTSTVSQPDAPQPAASDREAAPATATVRPDLPAAVLFDMDGTLIDSEPLWMAAETALVESFGGTWTHEDALAMVGNPLEVSAEIILERTPVDLPRDEIIHRLLAEVTAGVRQHMPWRPGSRELLAECVERRVPTALVTMSWTSLAEAFTDALPAGTFDTVVTGDAVTHGKPHPEPYLTAAERLGVDPAACLALEDSPSGVGSASAAGTHLVAIPLMVDLPETPNTVTVTTLEGETLSSLWERFTH
ncbi:HAD family hydrolase [Kytococcus schroeteri]|uniref:HAD family hydrolase n=1 Tax=Kytococcus schroeteri TaxID=138300 RepID=UPI001EE182B2|nr:HAD family phosphatase [Kytococcus schroeteri]